VAIEENITMSTASIRETLLQEISTLSPAYYSEVLNLIASLKAGIASKGDDFSVPLEEFEKCTESIKKRPKLGGWEGKIWIADDVNAPMEEFGEYEEFFEPRHIVPKLGSLKGKIWMADDFDAPLEEFEEYM
jgi:hypothetical protein